MAAGTAPEIKAIEDALNTLEQEARSVAAGLSEDQGTWRERPDSWSVAECLDHLATANEVLSAGDGTAGRTGTRAGKSASPPRRCRDSSGDGSCARSNRRSSRPSRERRQNSSGRDHRRRWPTRCAAFSVPRTSRARSCAGTPTSTSRAFASPIRSSAASASALPPAST